MDEDNEGSAVTRPRIIDTAVYVKVRVDQILDLLEVVDNSALGAGEVTSGPRTVFQRLPRHMRRRAMSHNIKRLPRSVRPIAEKITKLTKHRKKPPSRKWRRRPSRMLKRSAREQRKGVWLETHIWHAKRFRMAELWGYKLPLQSYQRGFRPTFRNSAHATVAIDMSYLCCFQIVGKNPQQILTVFSTFCQAEVSSTIAQKAALKGELELSTLLYTPLKYPRGFLGAARFSWSSNESSSRLQLWIHPSMEKRFLKAIVTMENVELMAHKIGVLRLKNARKLEESAGAKMEVGEEKIKVLNLRNQFGRIQLIGPCAFPLLHLVLSLVSDSELAEDPQFAEFRDSHEYWRSEASRILPGNLRAGTVFSLLVEDPRLFRAKRARNLLPAPTSTTSFDPPPPCKRFWDLDFQEAQLQKRFSHAQLQKAQEGRLMELDKTPFKIPILLVVRRSTAIPAPSTGASSSAAVNRVDLLCPGGTAYDFWLALQFGNARAAGLRDKISLDFEGGSPNFPADSPDTEAGKSYADAETVSLQEKYLRKPHNRRIDFTGRLRVAHPFSFEWQLLLRQWLRCAELDHSQTDDVFVIRSRQLLFQLNDWLLKGKAPLPEELVVANRHALVPITIQHVARGCPKRFALICAPTEEDLVNLRANQKTAKIVEGSEEESKKNGVDSDEDEEMETGSGGASLSGYVSLFAATSNTYFDQSKQKFEKLVSLNELFPAAEVNPKRVRNIRKRQKRKESAKRRKLLAGNATAAAEVCQQKVSETMPESDYVESCSRRVLGRVTRGDYSFTCARGIALGYVPLVALIRSVGKDRLVLVRNTTSKYYHPARISVNFSSGDI